MTNIDLLIASKWSGILTLVIIVFTIIAFVFKWGFRFRFVGVSSFMAVLTIGIFSLSLALSTRAQIPGATHYTLVYDNGGNQTVIAVAPSITKEELQATLQQASVDLFSFGRIGGTNGQLVIRARTIVHPKPGMSEPLYLGEVKRSLSDKTDDPQIPIQIFDKNLERSHKLAA